MFHGPVIALRRLYTEYDAIYVSKLRTNYVRTKMYQNTCVNFKRGYLDAKSDAIAFYVKTYPSGSFLENRTNIHEMQNRMKIAFCVKPPLPSILLADKGGPTRSFGRGGSVGLAQALFAGNAIDGFARSQSQTQKR